ncbi:MAG: hypothetical protein M1814_002174 [Vezdaea aestivalis]|nr:MAG: hypothetical protein M1814_002174 [Vezdaea aestivalis]
MSLKNDQFPSSAAFDAISSALSNEADRKDAIKKAGAVFGITLKNSDDVEESWHIDLKKEGVVGKGVSPQGVKPNVTLILSDEDFGKLVAGKAKAQKLFMGGKLKIKGEVMKATKIEPLLAKAAGNAKL